MLRVAFLKCANLRKYGKLMMSIRDQHSSKKDIFPKSLPKIYELLENYSSAKTGDKKKPPLKRGGGGRGRGGRGRGGCVGGIQFAQQAEVVPGLDGCAIVHIKCFKYNKLGRYSDYCPDTVEGDQIYINAYEIMMSDHEDTEDKDDNETTTQQEEEAEEDIDVSNVESEEEDEATEDE